jgi:hypothetical protein
MKTQTKCNVIGFIAGAFMGGIWGYFDFSADPLQPWLTCEVLMLARGFFWGLVGLAGGQVTGRLITELFQCTQRRQKSSRA